MSEWWETPYEGGPMVAVKGFPRPLYPPDVQGHPASVDGSDVEAYKRTIARAGRWKWQRFDQAFSNAFSHGAAGGNVGDSGVAGVQRQQKMANPSGWVGKETFNLLRSILIPAGLPWEGQPAMDARAVELVNAAWSRFGGSEPLPEPPPQKTSSALARLKIALTQVGTREYPLNTNMQKYGQWYGFNGVPWCAIFATWCDCISARPSMVFARGRNWSYVPDIVSLARRGMAGLYVTSTPQPGDLIAYDWGRDGTFDHLGIFEAGDSRAWSAVEGNTGPIRLSNGGEVMHTSRSRAMANVVFIHVREPTI